MKKFLLCSFLIILCSCPVVAYTTGDLTVTAEYEANKYTVKFVDWDGTVLKEEIVDQGSTATEPADPKRTGHIFSGWDLPYNNITRDMTVTAEYVNRTYNVVFMVDDSTFNRQTVNYGNAATDPGAPVKEGGIFTGWDVDFKNITDNLTVTAEFEINMYTVKFVNWDGAVLKEQTVEYGFDAFPPVTTPERTGYTFTDWDVTYSNIIGNLTVTAKFEINEHTVKFVNWDGTVLKEQTVEYGSAATAPDTNLERKNYIFTGWDVGFTNITGNLTVTAVFEPNECTVKFVNWNGTVLKEQTVEHGSAATAPDTEPTRTGHAFTGWDVDFTNITDNLTVTAQFNEFNDVKTFTITYWNRFNGSTGLTYTAYAGVPFKLETDFSYYMWGNMTGFDGKWHWSPGEGSGEEWYPLEVVDGYAMITQNVLLKPVI